MLRHEIIAYLRLQNPTLIPHRIITRVDYRKIMLIDLPNGSLRIDNFFVRDVSAKPTHAASNIVIRCQIGKVNRFHCNGIFFRSL